MVRSEPFAYAAAVRAMRAAAVRGQTPSTAHVTLHGWFLRVAPPRPAAGGGFEVAVSVQDGTGSVDAVVPAAMTLKLIDVPSAAAFDAMDEASRARLRDSGPSPTCAGSSGRSRSACARSTTARPRRC